MTDIDISAAARALGALGGRAKGGKKAAAQDDARGRDSDRRAPTGT